MHTHGRRGALIGALGIVLAGCRGEAPPEVRTVDDEPLLVVQDRGPTVVSGKDTTMVLAPTVFAWFDVSTPTAPPGAPGGDALQRFRQSLSDALPRLREMGVRVVQQSARPTVVDLPDGTPAPTPGAGAPPPLGYLLVDIEGHVERRDGVLDGPALVCLASHTFRVAAPGC